jgi:polyisoprenoid-binding protein YceI
MTRNRVIAAIVVLFLIGGGGLYFAYTQVLQGDSTPALTLPAATAAAGSSAAVVAPTLTAATAAGDWTVATGSQAGYRVREQLAGVSAESDAVGRTDKVTGTATVAASGSSVQVTKASLTVDTTSIASDKSQRDDRLRNQGLETDNFKTATFTLTTPVDVPADAFNGSIVDVTLHGDLTLHGVTKTVDIPAKAQISGNQIDVSGSIDFPFSDYSMTAPNVGGFILSVEDHGALEFLLVLQHA